MENIKEVKDVKKKRLTLESTILLTVGGTTLAIVVYGIIHAILTGF